MFLSHSLAAVVEEILEEDSVEDVVNAEIPTVPREEKICRSRWRFLL